MSTLFKVCPRVKFIYLFIFFFSPVVESQKFTRANINVDFCEFTIITTE